MQSAKETAANVAASAKAGMEKTKATLQEKGERLTTRDPLQKDIATQKKEEAIHEAERQKLEARDQNAAARHTGGGVMGHEYTTGQQPHVVHPHGTTTQAGVRDPRDVPGSGISGGVGPQDPNVGGGARTGYGAGNTI